MSPRKKTTRIRISKTAAAPASGTPQGERELIVITKSDAGARARSLASPAAPGRATGLAKILEDDGAYMKPLFGASEERVRSAAARAPGAPVEQMARFYRVDAPDRGLSALAEKLLEHPDVEAAYVKPPTLPPGLMEGVVPLPEEPPPSTPDFNARQIYLDAAPGGIDARFAWTRTGGGGAGVRIIDVEGSWRFSHEDLMQNQGGVVGGTQYPEVDWRNHGTAVLGEFSGDRNSIGVTGICPDANVRAISHGTIGSAAAIRRAADLLGAGDIILLEMHRPGPRHNFTLRNDQLGYIAVEWWPDDLAAIVYATSRGIIVIEAAGNGAENLDDGIYDTRPAGFPTTWVNPFRRAPDSLAVIVGAGAPPPNTHGRDHGPDRSRLDFSNYGACVDTQGWGREVTTCGYGDLQGGANEDLWYTDIFSGTSSASPIIVGAVGALQGALRAASKPLLTPATARNILRTTGSPQQDAPGRPASQRIGNRPDLRQAMQRLGVGGIKLPKEIFKEVKEKDLKDIKDKDLKEHKEFKEIKEKDLKDHKEKDLKELKDKDLKDHKEKDLKEHKEKDLKEIKEKDKDFEQSGILDRVDFGPQSQPKQLKEKENEKQLTKEHKDKEKDIKEFKEKDFKDHKEHKEFKEKDTKELKDKDFKEHKDFKEKDTKELKDKDFKEHKDFKEFKEIEIDFTGGQELQRNPASSGANPSGGSMEERVAGLEQTVAQLVHFISPELRPDLVASALGQENDLQKLSAQLRTQADAAKTAKDQKDIEKVSDT
jgi:Subtilase family